VINEAVRTDAERETLIDVSRLLIRLDAFNIDAAMISSGS